MGKGSRTPPFDVVGMCSDCHYRPIAGRFHNSRSSYLGIGQRDPPSRFGVLLHQHTIRGARMATFLAIEERECDLQSPWSLASYVFSFKSSIARPWRGPPECR